MAPLNDPPWNDLFADAEQRFAVGGAAGLLAFLKESLLREGLYDRLFDLLLLAARRELGLPLVLTGSPPAMSDAVRDRYEAAVVSACREVGSRWLEAGVWTRAYRYFQTIGEFESLRAALHRYDPGSAAGDFPTTQEQVVELAFYRGVHPEKGLELLLATAGMCQSITATEQLLGDAIPAADRDACIRLLVRRIHAELHARVWSHIEEQEKSGTRTSDDDATPADDPGNGARGMLVEAVDGRDWLFVDNNYHVDPSHIGAVVRMSRLLRPPAEEIALARDLCAYGSQLASCYRYADHPPFEDLYEETARFLTGLMGGPEAEASIVYFRDKGERLRQEKGEARVAAVEVELVLLATHGRYGEACDRLMECWREEPQAFDVLTGSLLDWCQRAGDFERLMKLARERTDQVAFAAGLLQRSID